MPQNYDPTRSFIFFYIELYVELLNFKKPTSHRICRIGCYYINVADDLL